jgi:hypothetical protein
MVPENTAAHKFFEYTRYQMRIRHAWPHATNPDRVTVMKWSLRVADTVVADLETVDFGGEVFRSAFREGEPSANGMAAQEEMLQYLAASNFIVVTVSLGVLVRDIELGVGMSASDIARDSEAKWVTRGLIDFVQRNMPPETGLLIVLTQADMYRAELERFGGPSGLFKKSWPTVAALYPDVPILAISAVSEVSEDGGPAEGFSSEGVLPIMCAFADHCVGGLDAFRASIKAKFDMILNAPDDMEPDSYRALIDKYSEEVAIFQSASGLSGDRYDEELKKYQVDLEKIEKDSVEKLQRLEAVARVRREAEAEKRRKEEEAAAEKRRKEEEEAAERRRKEEAAERKRREEEAKRLEDERIRAEKELEKSRLEAEVEFEKTRAMMKKNRTRALIAVISLVAVVCVCGLYYLVDNSMRRAEVESMKIREMQRAALAERLQKIVGMAHSGDVESARKIVDMLDRNEIAESDVNGLYKIYMMLVNEGDARSMFRLGLACHKGTCGVKKSDFNAHWFLSMAKNSGYVSSELDGLLEKTSVATGDGKTKNEGIDSLFGTGTTGEVVIIQETMRVP